MTTMRLTHVPIPGSQHVYLNGAEMQQGVDWTDDGAGTLTFLGPMAEVSNDLIECRYAHRGQLIAPQALTTYAHPSFRFLVGPLLGVGEQTISFQMDRAFWLGEWRHAAINWSATWYDPANETYQMVAGSGTYGGSDSTGTNYVRTDTYAPYASGWILKRFVVYFGSRNVGAYGAVNGDIALDWIAGTGTPGWVTDNEYVAPVFRHTDWAVVGESRTVVVMPVLPVYGQTASFQVRFEHSGTSPTTYSRTSHKLQVYRRNTTTGEVSAGYSNIGYSGYELLGDPLGTVVATVSAHSAPYVFDHLQIGYDTTNGNTGPVWEDFWYPVGHPLDPR